jgi:hypothetical protein
MSIWLDWLILAISIGTMMVGLLDRQHGRRLVIVSAILALTATARLVPASLTVVRYAAWAAAVALIVYALATTSRETYRKLRLEFSLLAGAAACILATFIPGLPQLAEIVLAVAAAVMLVASFAVSISRTMKFGA